MNIVHRLASGGYIARNGAAVDVCIGPGTGGVPMVVSFEGEALAALAAAAMAAFRERPDMVAEKARAVEAARPEVCSPELRYRAAIETPRYTIRRPGNPGRAERDAREWLRKKGLST